MNILLYLLFIGLFSLDWLSLKLKLLPGLFSQIPDVLSLLTALIVIFILAYKKTHLIHPKYIFFFFILIILIIGNMFVNKVDPGVIFSGIRIYFKYIPFFFLPLVYMFSEEQKKKQIMFILLLALMQTPVALTQKFILYPNMSGDLVGGTLGTNTSGLLSVFLACCIAIIMSFYLRKRINIKIFIIMLIILVIPMTINETKISIFLIPFAILSPILFYSKIRHKTFMLVSGVLITSTLMLGYIQIYDHFRAARTGMSITDWITDEEKVSSYLSKDKEYKDLPEEEVARFDSIKLAVKYLNRTGNLLVGVGIGNASPSSISERLEGKYYKEYGWTDTTKVFLTRILWEMGIAGIIMYIYFFIAVFIDARGVASKNTFMSSIAHGWLSIVIIIGATFLYLKTFDTNLISYLFWYISGLIVAEQYKIRLHMSEKTPIPISGTNNL